MARIEIQAYPIWNGYIITVIKNRAVSKYWYIHRMALRDTGLWFYGEDGATHGLIEIGKRDSVKLNFVQSNQSALIQKETANITC